MEHHIIEIKCRLRNIFLVSIYRPPNTPILEFLKEYESHLNKLNKEKNSDVIIGMDHNLDFLKSNHHRQTKSFIEINLDQNYLPCITKPTRITKSTATLIYNIFISQNLQGKQDCKILIEDLSDHLPSLLTLSGHFLEQKTIPTVTTCELNDEAYKNINSTLNSYDWNAKLSNKNVDECFEEWHSTVQSMINQYALERVVKLTKKQLKRDLWITPSLLKSCTRQRKLYKLAIKSKNDPLTWDKYYAYKVTLDRIKRNLKKITTSPNVLYLNIIHVSFGK